jgi:hypothetical protein
MNVSLRLSWNCDVKFFFHLLKRVGSPAFEAAVAECLDDAVDNENT